MLFPLVVGLVAVALGALLALGPPSGTKIIAPIRIVSVLAAFGVIVVHLLPEAYRAIGIWSAAAFAGGLAVPKAVEWVADRIARSSGAKTVHGDSSDKGRASSHTALEIGYAGLLVHRFGDGVSMGAYARLPGSTLAHAPVMLAFAAHIVPVTTVMVLAALSAKGRSTALGYAAGLAVVIAAGVVAAGVVLTDVSHGVEPWISAVVAGLLLHVVVHSAGEGTSMFGKKK